MPNRQTKLGTLVLCGIEATHVVHEVSNGRNFFEEAGKSALTLGTTTVATGVLIGSLTNKAVN